MSKDFDYDDDQITPVRCAALTLLFLVQWGSLGAWAALVVHMLVLSFNSR